MEKWQCVSCGCILDIAVSRGQKLPETCPSCKKKCEFKEITDYVPKHIPRKERI